MFKDETDFEKVVDRLNVDITPNPEHREKLRRQMLSVFSTTVQQSQKRIAPIGAFRRKFMRSRMTKLAAAVVIIIAVLVGINPFSRSNGSFAAMIENTEQMPWIHIVSSKYRGSDEHRTEAWMSLRSKIIAKKWDDTLTFVSGIEQREYLYDSSQNKIFVSSGDYSRPAFYSPIELMRTYIHRIETMAVSFKTEDKLIDGIQMEIISVQVPEGTEFASVELFRDKENDLLTRMEVTFPDPSKKIVSVYDYPETGPLSVYDLGISHDVEVVHLIVPPELQELREKTDSLRNANVQPYVAISIPSNVTQLPTSFSGERDAVIGIWRKNNNWRCDIGYYTENKSTILTPETLADSAQYAAKSLIPAISYIVDTKRCKTYTLVRKEWGDGKLHKRSATSYPGNNSVENLCWPRMTGTVGVPVKWKVESVTDPNGESLILIERTQDGRVPNDKGTYVMPTRNRWFLNPERSNICQKHERSILLHADWVINKHWLEGQENPRLEWAGRDYESTIEILEYARTSSGRWYPRVVKETTLWYNHRNGETMVDKRSSYSTCRKVYLEENPDFPDVIFDPENLSK